MRNWTEKLYELLPAVYRMRDVERGEPLKGLLAVLGEQADVVEADIFRLYRNWFIETCDEWVVPYIGDLLGVSGLHPIHSAGISQRAFVANTLRYRRRKGTATVLEQLACDTTGWRARAVEFFERLATTQYINHIRPHNARTPDLRSTSALELLDTAFDTIAHTADVRHISLDRGRHNISNIGIFLWRLQAYFVPGGSARAVTEPADGRYRFHPLGLDANLFNRTETETKITRSAGEANVPGLLRRRALYDELEDRRQAVIDGRSPKTSYFGRQPVFQVFVRENAGSKLTGIPPENILICNLGDPAAPLPEGWLRPPTRKAYQPAEGGPERFHPVSIAVDPERGRLAFPEGILPRQVKVGYAYGFSGDLGGGPYDRRGSVYTALTRPVTWQVGVSKEIEPKTGEIFAGVSEAIHEWNAQPAGSFGVISILDGFTYEETFPVIDIPEGSRLLVVAAKWPEVQVPGGLPGQRHRVPGSLDPNGLRPHLLGDLKVKGAAAGDSLSPGDLILDGLLVEGGVSVRHGHLGSLRLAHSTLVPGKGGLTVESGNGHLKIELVSGICGAISIPSEISKLSVEGSIIDRSGGEEKAIAAPRTPLEVQKSTVFGGIQGLSIVGGNCIFRDVIAVVRRQEGCIRFSYVADGSEHPRCFRCQPELEISRRISEASEKGSVSAAARNRIRRNVLGWLVPSFTSTRYGHHAYAQLSRHCPLPLRVGADDGSEMGAFCDLKQPQREANLKSTIDGYLRFGLEAGIITVT